jgi:hexokinase
MQSLPTSPVFTNREPGSFADVPKDLLKEIEQLERLFTVDTAKLKQITDHFVNELDKG